MLFFKKKKFTTTQMITGGFLIAILIGGCVLTLPIASKNGEFTPFIDALFTATTSICVTGLTTVVTAEHWSFFGQVVILALIQFGGFGVVTFTTTILLILRKRITLMDRLLIQDAYNLDTLRGLVKLTIKIMQGTLIVEGIGAIFYCFQFIPEFGVIKGIWYSIFHGISAFCNAGIDLIGPTSFVPYQTNPLININTMVLIILGGIGYPVWWDIIKKSRLAVKEQFSMKKYIKKLDLHTKIALTVTGMLILFGAAFIFLNEYNNELTIGKLSLGNKVMASFFQSVTLRTAGYFTIPQESLRNGSAFIGVIFMFIGGSPSGTAGGIKTVTIAVLILAALSSIKGKQDVEIYHRKIIDGYIKKALAVFLFSFTTLMVSTICLSVVENRDFIDILYEVASALGTVGLSRDVTLSLSPIGKIIIIITMYLGRIGPISLALALNVSKDKSKGLRLPEEKILVG
ncbi:trk system potassium uptake protein TrkH [Mobilisporobacter senegalensis]|uniref:Trk system potassium uptake protein TrkH n=1 Tax=Mobilisporobacter senegalensis TaxID=1329262 RepID=A0A3N1XY40_9FIRM|nr:potassium transporter TrkG [Mobilisporobacter senegalensis]ROR31514.1 trk system potassium uptake protein TrkH [Mobilisporobacter senegalensis]